MQRKKRLQISNKIKLSNTVRITLMFFSVAIIAMGSCRLIKSLFARNYTTTQNKEIYKYNNEFKEDTTINLKDNEFVLESEIEKGQTYLSDLISSIDFNMDYKYTDSEPTDITYNYKIEATIKSVYSNSKGTYDVLNKTDVLKTEENKKANSKNLNIKEKINVDYAKYHQIIKDFKQEMGIAVDSFLYVKLIVNTKAKIGEQEVENEYSSEYSITLGDKIALIEDNSAAENSNSITEKITNKHNSSISSKTVIVNIFIMLVGVVLLRYVLTRTEELRTIRNEYKLELNRILKSCENKLVQIEDINQIDIENATKVKDIYQLLRLSDEALVPIYCYIKEEPVEEAFFIVTKYEKSYIYILKQKGM